MSIGLFDDAAERLELRERREARADGLEARQLARAAARSLFEAGQTPEAVAARLGDALLWRKGALVARDRRAAAALEVARRWQAEFTEQDPRG